MPEAKDSALVPSVRAELIQASGVDSLLSQSVEHLCACQEKASARILDAVGLCGRNGEWPPVTRTPPSRPNMSWTGSGRGSSAPTTASSTSPAGTRDVTLEVGLAEGLNQDYYILFRLGRGGKKEPPADLRGVQRLA